MTPRIVDGRAMKLAGMNQSYTWQNMDEIPELWHKFGPQIDRIPGQVGEVAYGAIHSEREDGFEYMAAVEVSGGEDLPDGFTTMDLPSLKYAVFTHEGHVSKLCDTIDFAFNKWLQESEFAYRQDCATLERYGETFDPEIGEGDVEVWVAITEK